MKKSAVLFLYIGLFGCNQQDQEISKAQSIASPQITPTVQFDDSAAKKNLVFIKDQYLKMIKNIDNNEHLHFANNCDTHSNVCFPRAKEHDAIFMEKATKWTNGFYPGLLWKLLSANKEIDNFTTDEQMQILAKAKYYQKALLPETLRGSTHDLGFILYDSFGEALNYDGLSEADRHQYNEALKIGRKTLATRYFPEKGLIKSWDWKPTFSAHTLIDGEISKKAMTLAEPWDFPVIVDNMMNLEYFMSSDNTDYRELAFSHAKQTYLKHYFYAEDDINQDFPIAYHVFDYGKNRPGNWQGVGNISAWARGQGWSLYGFVTVAEALKAQGSDMELPNFELHIEKLINSIAKLMKDDAVPYWDYYATLPSAAEIAANQSNLTAQYSHILDLCDFQIAANILPYNGYAPIKIAKNIVSKETLTQLSSLTSVYKEPFVQGDYILPCGSKPFKNKATHIPRDSSAAALYAAALYRLAKFTEKTQLRAKAINFADKIMLELTTNYLTSKNKAQDYQLGFALTEATGNLPNASEINTSIVYADFYFLEANMLKLELSDNH